MPSTNKLVDARDKLNADINALIAKAQASATIDQPAVDNITAEATALDLDVVNLLGTDQPPALDFTAFDVAVSAFKQRATTQARIDALTSTIIGA